MSANTIDMKAAEGVGYVAKQGASPGACFDRRQWTPLSEDMLRGVVRYSILQQDIFSFAINP